MKFHEGDIVKVKKELFNLDHYYAKICDYEWDIDNDIFTLVLDQSKESGLEFIFTASGNYDDRDEGYEVMEIDRIGFGLKFAQDENCAWHKTTSFSHGRIDNNECDLELEEIENELESLFIDVYAFFLNIELGDLAFVEKKIKMENRIKEMGSEIKKLTKELDNTRKEIDKLVSQRLNSLYEKMQQ